MSKKIIFQTQNHLSLFLMIFVLYSAVFIIVFVLSISWYFLIVYILLSIFLFGKFVKKFIFYENRVEIIYPFRVNYKWIKKELYLNYKEVEKIIFNDNSFGKFPSITVKVKETQKKYTFDVADRFEIDKIINHCRNKGVEILIRKNYAWWM